MLDCRVTIIVPGTDHGQRIAPTVRQSWVDRIGERFADWFGGATADATSQGYYRDDTGRIVKESVVRVVGWTDRETLDAHANGIIRLARRLADTLGQECVAIEWPDGMELIRSAPIVQTV